MLFALIPVVAWLACALWLYGRSNPRTTFREALLVAALFAAGWLVLTTEILSLFHAIAFPSILIVWSLPLAVFLVLLWRDLRWRSAFAIPSLTRPQILAVGIILLALTWAAFQAGLTAPSTSDALAYHLQRQVYWLQQNSVEHYPTSSLRQLAMPPLAEFAGLHLMALTGSDLAHNFIQWLAFLLTILAASLITRKYNPAATAQLFAALAVLTIPMAFIQASNTKNDLVVALWTCSAMYFVFQLDDTRPWRWQTVCCIGLSLGALLLTKGTGLIFGLPIAAAALFFLRRHRHSLRALSIIAAIVLAMNAPHLWRNQKAFGSPIPNDPAIHGGDTLANQDFSSRAMLSNILRNLAPHFVLPYQPWNDKLQSLVQAAHRLLGIDINDPRTTYQHGQFQGYAFQQNRDGFSAEPAHMFLLMCLPFLLALTWRQAPRRPILILLAVVAADFLLFSTLLKWQTWHLRLIIPMPALLAPVFAWTCCNPTVRSTAFRLSSAAAALVLLVGLLPSVNCVQRPLVGPRNIRSADRQATRFSTTPPDIAFADLRAVDIVRSLHPRIVGFSTGWSSNDYLIQRPLLDQLQPPPVFTSFNASLQITGKPEPDPDVLLASELAATLRHTSTGTPYKLIANLDSYAIYTKVTPAAPPPSAPYTNP